MDEIDKCAIENIPTEMFMAILFDLDNVTIVIAMFVCKQWKRIILGFLSSRIINKTEFSDYVAKKGYLNLIIWAREQGCEWDSGTCSYAAKGGHLEVLKWARENGCEWNSSTCSNAASGGHLEVLKWAREHGCHWTSFTCSCAARRGHLEVLKWAREHGCKWNSDTCS